MLRAISLILVLLGPTSALGAERKVTASNGVEVQIESDDFKPNTVFRVDVLKSKVGWSSVSPGANLALSRGSDRPDLLGLQLQIAYSGEWRMYDGAFLRGGVALEFSSVRRDVVSCRSRPCTLYESMVAALPREALEELSAAGDVEVKFTARRAPSGDYVVTVPASAVRALLEVADQERAAR
jgi:hypothetical protein